MAAREKADTIIYDPTNTCPKCRHDDVSTVYRTGREYACREHRSWRFSWDDAEPEDEHFDRTCQRCHFSWREELG